MELVFASWETKCRYKVREIEFVAWFLCLSHITPVFGNIRCVLWIVQIPKKSLWGREIFIAAVDLYNTYHLCGLSRKTKGMWIFSLPDIDLSHSKSHACKCHTLPSPCAASHPFLSYQDTHTHTCAHTNTHCVGMFQDVLWPYPSFIPPPSLHPSLLFCRSYQRALCPCQIERRQAISQSLSLCFSCLLLSIWLVPK